MARNMLKHVGYVSRTFVVPGVASLLAINNRAEASDVGILPVLLT